MSLLRNFVQDPSFSDASQLLSAVEPQKKETSSVQPAEISPTEKATKKKYDEFMKVLARDENLKPLDPNDLIPHLLLERVISHEDYEETETIKNISARKVVRVSNNNIE